MPIDWKSKQTRIVAAVLGGAILLGGGFAGYAAYQKAQAPTHMHVAKDGTYYTCPMHPQVKSETPGSCPICGMDLVKQEAPAAQAAGAQADEKGKTVYTCPMHPQVIADAPGSCPICGMDLVPKQAPPAASQPAAGEADMGSMAASPPVPAGLSEVTLSPEQQVLANVKTAPVQNQRLVDPVRAAGKITYDESRLAKVTARVEGRIERMYVDTTGARISKGQPMATIYSPELVATMKEYLVALESYQQMRKSPYPDLAEGSKAMLDAAQQRLRLWGVTPAQIDQLRRTGKPDLSLPLLAPQTGTVIERKIQPGEYVKEGDELYAIADLSKVWVEADVFENQMKELKVGQRVEVTTPAYPARTFVGRLSFVYPFVNPETRTVKIRAELDNPSGLLKPDMFVTATVNTATGRNEQLVVPATAVIDTGRRKIVYVETQPGVFRPREVKLGSKTGQFYPIQSGLEPGERVATSGGFLIDANSQIQSGAGTESMPGMDMGHEGTHP